MGENHNHIHHHEVNEGDEILALLRYMAGHNESHTEELYSLAKQLNTNENEKAYKLVLQAIENYKKGNAYLESALDLLK